MSRKPKPKFKVGDRVRDKRYDEAPFVVGAIVYDLSDGWIYVPDSCNKRGRSRFIRGAF
jgi:hypothetical protein